MRNIVGMQRGYSRSVAWAAIILTVVFSSATTLQAEVVRVDVIKVTGMSSVNGKHMALIEAPPSSARGQMKFPILEEGKSQYGIEFVGFDAGTGMARFRDAEKERTIKLQPGGAVTLQLKDADIRQVVALYARWTSRVQVVGPPVGGGRIDFRSEPEESIKSVQQKLKTISREKGFVLQEVKEQFLLVDRVENVNVLGNAAEVIGRAPTHNARAKSELSDNPIQLNFERAHLARVLELYSELTCRTLLHSSRLPMTLFITLKSEFPVSRADAIQGIESVLALDKIQTRSVGESFILVTVPAEAETSKIVGDELASQLKKEAEGDAKPEPFSGPVSFINMPLSQFCAVYADAVAGTLLDAGAIPRQFLNLKSSYPWTKAETLGAYDALLALNGFKMVREGEKGLRLVPR